MMKGIGKWLQMGAALCLAAAMMLPQSAFAKEKKAEEKKTAIKNVFIDPALAVEVEEKPGQTAEPVTVKAILPDSLLELAGQTANADEHEQESMPAADALSFTTDAVALEIAGEPLVYVKSAADAEEVIREILLQFMTEKELENYRKEQAGIKIAGKKTASRVTNVELSSPVIIKEAVVKPKQIMTAEKAAAFFKKGLSVEAYDQAEKGDSAADLAEKHSMDLKRLKELNPELPMKGDVEEGETIQLELHIPYFDVQVTRKVTEKETIAYKKVYVKAPELLKGKEQTVRKGKNGKLKRTSVVIDTNGKTFSEKEKSVKVLKKPVSEKVKKGTKVIPSVGSGTFAWPADGGYISSKQGHRWGKLHKGIDIARPATRTLKAADHGVVTFAGVSSGYGNKVTISHNNGYQTHYAHMASISVKPGQVVEKGSKIGVMGSTGHSTGVHLHFEIYKNGSLVNPLDYISQ